MAADVDLAEFPTLTTERLVLRELAPADAADLFAFRSDADAQRYNSEPMQDPAQATRLIEDLRADYATRTGIHWALTLRDDAHVIGLVGLGSWDHYHRRAEIGYDLHRKSWGAGLATEAVREVLRFGFERLTLHRIEAHTIADNHPSVRLLQRLGFHRDGVRREHSWEEDGRFHDSLVYSLIDRDFG